VISGTDYNTRIPGIGPAKGLKLIKEFSRIEDIPLDVSNLKYVRTRQLFREHPGPKDITIPYCGKPDFKKLELFVRKNNIRCNMDNLKAAFTQNVIIFGEDEETDIETDGKDEESKNIMIKKLDNLSVDDEEDNIVIEDDE
jgi:5'-3' exonuclease